MTNPNQLADIQQGWVQLPRNILHSSIIKNPTLIQTYIWSLLKANHQPKWFSIKVGKGHKEVYCDVGQFITGRNRAADELGMPGSTWYTNITKLKDYGYLDIESNSHYSLITVVNYGGAAPDAKPMEQQKKKAKNNKTTTKEQPNNTNNNYKNEKNKKTNNDIISNSNFENEKIDKWINEAFNELQGQISKDYPNINRLPQQLTQDEFRELFTMYDWIDIIEKCKDLNVWPPIINQKSLYQILKIFLNKDKSIGLIANIEANSYIDDRLFNEKMHNKFLEEQRQIRLKDGLYDNIDNDVTGLYAELNNSTIWNDVDLSSHKNRKRKVVKNYLRFRFLLSQQKKIAKAYDLSEFKIESYLEFVDAGFTYEALRYYIDQFANWSKLKAYDNIFEGYGKFLYHLMDIGKYEHI